MLELEGADAHGSIPALSPPEVLQGTAGIHGCDTTGWTTLLHQEPPLFCGMEERGKGMEKKWKRGQRRGGKEVKKRLEKGVEEREKGMEERWERG